MNIPARYATDHLGGPSDPTPMDVSVWFDAYLDGPAGPGWYAFDARHNRPRIGRIVMALGRDATDCAITTSVAPSPLAGFTVLTEEIAEAIAGRSRSDAPSLFCTA